MAGHKAQLEMERWIENYEGRESQITASQSDARQKVMVDGGEESVQSSAGVGESGYGCSRFPVTVGGPMTYSRWASLLSCAGSWIFLWVLSSNISSACVRDHTPHP